MITELMKDKTKMNIDFFDKNYSLAVKGVAIFIIIVSHVGNLFVRFFTPLGGVGVSLFLMVSGYGLAASADKNGLKYYWTKRISNVFFPYLIFETIRLLAITKEHITKWDYVKDVLGVKPLMPNGWYINYILLCYIIFWLVWRLTKGCSRKLILLLGIWAVLSFIFFRDSELRAEQVLSFFSGVYIYFNLNKCRRMLNLKNAIILFVIGTLFLALKQWDFIRTIQPLFYNVLQLIIKYSYALFLIVFIFYFARLSKSFYYIFNGLGNISFALYLVHGVVMDLIPIDSVGTLSVFVLISLVVSILVNIVIKQVSKIYSYFIRAFLRVWGIKDESASS